MSSLIKAFSNVLVGADPELFLKNPNSGLFVSGHGMIKGTKERPHKVERGAVQVDGTALEFNIDPAATEDQFVDSIRVVRGALSSMVTGYSLVAEPVADYSPEYFSSIPISAKILGCEPDYNAWELGPNPKPEGDRPFRTGAGHIHIGWCTNADPWTSEHYELCAEVSRQLDYYLGINSLLWDSDCRRRDLYGKAGAFRPKPYGVEYRTLSNRWLASELLTRWVYVATRKAMDDLAVGVRQEDYYGPLARSIIDENQLDWPTWNVIKIDGLPSPPRLKAEAA